MVCSLCLPRRNTEVRVVLEIGDRFKAAAGVELHWSPQRIDNGHPEDRPFDSGRNRGGVHFHLFASRGKLQNTVTADNMPKPADLMATKHSLLLTSPSQPWPFSTQTRNTRATWLRLFKTSCILTLPPQTGDTIRAFDLFLISRILLGRSA